jgi:Kef-type K+ transport system membrane component KefB
VLGQIFAPRIGKWLSKINPGISMKLTLAFGSALIFAYLAEAIGLAPIVGAFTVGLIMEPVHFRHFDDPEIIHNLRKAVKKTTVETRSEVEQVLERHADHHIEQLLEPVSQILVPIFFVITGMQVQLETLFNPSILLVALGITVAAIIGKLVAGWTVGRGLNRSVVGWGMVPRGEVGLIFASIGKSLGVVSDEVFSVIIIMVILTTLLTPPILTFLLKRQKAQPV